MWYVIQTITGREQELVNDIQKVMAGKEKKYDRCFVLYQESIQCKHGIWENHIEPLFPSYVFVETDAPEKFFLELRQVPKMSHFLGVDGCVWSIYKEEELFLRRLVEESSRKAEKGSRGKAEANSSTKAEEDHRGKAEEGSIRWKEEKNSAMDSYIVRPSLVWADEEGRIQRAEGVLGFYMDKIVKQRLRKRSVIIEIPFCGSMRRIRLGIRLEEDGKRK